MMHVLYFEGVISTQPTRARRRGGRVADGGSGAAAAATATTARAKALARQLAEEEEAPSEWR